MSPEEIRQLLEKYYDGETSQAEELILKKYFAGSDIPELPEPEKRIFSYYVSESEIPAPSDDFEKRIINAVESTDQEIKDLRGRRLISFTSGIAAGILILAASYLFLTRNRMPSDTFSNPEIAYNEAMKILCDVSGRMNNGIRMLEKVGMMQDAANKGFKILGEPASLTGEKMKPLYLLNNLQAGNENNKKNTKDKY